MLLRTLSHSVERKTLLTKAFFACSQKPYLLLKMVHFGEGNERMRPLEMLAVLNLCSIGWYIHSIHCSQG
jgi:hypothetical protein